MKNKELRKEFWKDFFKKKKITVMGLGLLGRGVGDIFFLAKYAEEIIVTDLKTKSQLKESLEKLKKYKNIRYTLGRHDLKDFENIDFVLKAAGVPIDSVFISHAKMSGVPVFMSTALFAKLTPAKVVGITGTRGKTTVTHMLYEILKKKYTKSKSKVYLGGNIQGMATLPLIEKTKIGDVVVLELDSWQLQGFGDLKISPSVSAFTTFMPDHLNYYRDNLNTYFLDKANIFKYQKKGDILRIGEQLCSLPRSLTKILPKDAHFISERVLPKKIKLRIPGEHNRYNAAITFSLARALKVPVGIIYKSLENFKGVPGRLEFLYTYKGVNIYNDTTATTPEALRVALEALGTNRNIILIAGGHDKGIDLSNLTESLGQYCKYVSLLNGSGTSRLILEKRIPKNLPYLVHKDIKSAFRDVLRQAKSGDTVLLSPGFASFGMFKNEYDRGDQFVALVKTLK